MPAPGAGLKNGPRFNVINKELHSQFVLTTGIQIPYDTFVTIINTSNEVIRRMCTTNIQGFKMPESLGYIAVTRYQPKPGARSIDWKRTRELGTRVYHTNFHSFGYKPKISWYMDTLVSCSNMNIYKFVPDRNFSRGVSAAVTAGKTYNELSYEHFKTKKIRLSKNISDGL